MPRHSHGHGVPHKKELVGKPADSGCSTLLVSVAMFLSIGFSMNVKVSGNGVSWPAADDDPCYHI